VLCWINLDFAVYAAFFFSAFFHSSGFFPDLFFTIKHYHIAVLFLVFTLAFKKAAFRVGSKNLKSVIASYFPWMSILGISTVAVLWAGNQIGRAFLTSANILTSILTSILVLWCAKKKEIILNCLLCFACGAALRIVLAAGWANLIDALYYREQIAYNNQIGFLAASALFMMFTFVLFDKHRIRRVVAWLLVAGLSFGLLLTCSRTAWVAFAASFLVFFHIICRMRNSEHGQVSMLPGKYFLAAVLWIFCIGLIIGVSFDYHLFERVKVLGFFLEPDMWRHTFADKHNFGFFGIRRLSQFSDLSRMMQENWILGVGFIRETTNFHSLYFMLLGGTGVLGLCLFLFFAIQWSKSLIQGLFQQDDGFNILRLGVFSSFFVWLIFSIMQTYILQFHIWLIVSLGIMLQERKSLGFNTRSKSNVSSESL